MIREAPMSRDNMFNRWRIEMNWSIAEAARHLGLHYNAAYAYSRGWVSMNTMLWLAMQALKDGHRIPE